MNKYTAEQKAQYYKKKYAAEKARKAQYKPAYKKTRKAMRAAPKERKPGMISAGGNALGAAIGTSIGGAPGGAIGSFLGGKLGHLIETITGFGDYTIEQNSIMKGGLTPPQIVNTTEKGGFIIRHREYIQDIVSTTDFTINKFPLNPGQRKSFPWLSQIAANFDQYRWRGVLFEFKSTSSDAVLSSATSSALGSVSMATDYDVADADYQSKREMLNSLFANSNKPSCTFIHPIECKSSLTPMRLQYVRPGGFPANTDPRMYDLGNTFIATEGMQAAGGVVGELWVTYEVEFYKQQVGSDALTDHFKLSSVAAGGWMGIGANSHDGDPYNSIGGKINDAGNSYTFPNNIGYGKFLFNIYMYGTSNATIANPTISVSNGSLLDLWNLSGSQVLIPTAATSAQYLSLSFVVQITGGDCVVQIGTAAVPGGTVIGDMFVCQIEQQLSDF